MQDVLKGFMGALSTLSVLPLWTDSIEGRTTVPWFPVVGLLLGVMVWAVATGVDYVTGGGMTLLTGLAVVVAGLVVTGGLHIDGLSDTFDGFFGGSTKERRLAIMKDSAIGTFGLVAVFTVLAAKLISVGYLAEAKELWQVVPAYIVSRTAQALLAATLKYARAEGGTGRAFVDGVTPVHGGIALLVGSLLLYIVAGIGAVALLVTGVGLTALCALVAQKKIGGVTGDVLGATSEIVEAVVLVAAAIFTTGLRAEGLFL